MLFFSNEDTFGTRGEKLLKVSAFFLDDKNLLYLGLLQGLDNIVCNGSAIDRQQRFKVWIILRTKLFGKSASKDECNG